jgi:hypothetical protein
MTKQNESAPKSIIVNVGDHGDMIALKKEFSTGSVGYYANGKIVVDGQMYQASVTLTLVGSKPDSGK